MSNRTRLLTLAAALAAAGCHEDGPTSLNDPTGSSDLAGEIATVPLPNGGSITFYNLGDGHIGFGEQVPATAGLVATELVDRHQATPLEVYLALSQDAGEVPDQLVQDHRRTTLARGGSTTPRVLAVPTAGTSVLGTPGFGDYICDSFGAAWINDWKAAFVGVTKYREAAYPHNFTKPVTFYPGAPVYYGTNTNSKTYLGVCNGDYEDQLMFQVHRWTSGQWKKILTVGVGGGRKYTFYSAIPARYRGKAYGWNGATIEHFGYGAAWTLSPVRSTP